jgi:hypothetical protein
MQALAATKTRSALFYGAAWFIATCLSTWVLVAAGAAS